MVAFRLGLHNGHAGSHVLCHMQSLAGRSAHPNGEEAGSTSGICQLTMHAYGWRGGGHTSTLCQPPTLEETISPGCFPFCAHQNLAAALDVSPAQTKTTIYIWVTHQNDNMHSSEVGERSKISKQIGKCFLHMRCSCTAGTKSRS